MWGRGISIMWAWRSGDICVAAARLMLPDIITHLARSRAMRKIKLTRVIHRENGGYVSLCPELDIASQGETVREARENLAEAVQGFFEVASRKEVRDRMTTRRY